MPFLWVLRIEVGVHEALAASGRDLQGRMEPEVQGFPGNTSEHLDARRRNGLASGGRLVPPMSGRSLYAAWMGTGES